MHVCEKREEESEGEVSVCSAVSHQLGSAEQHGVIEVKTAKTDAASGGGGEQVVAHEEGEGVDEEGPVEETGEALQSSVGEVLRGNANRLAGDDQGDRKRGYQSLVP